MRLTAGNATCPDLLGKKVQGNAEKTEKLCGSKRKPLRSLREKI
jgi:hypothetical protein